MFRLAINGGKPIRNKNFPAYQTIEKEEIFAVNNVLRSGILSKYIGAKHENFMGGPEVQLLEKEWAQFFNVKYAIAVNSASSALIAAVGSLDIEPGDEVIVSPYSMSISAVAPLFYGAIPVFADIEKDFYCLDPVSVESKITKKTKAIIVVDIFGQPHDFDGIDRIANKYGLKVITDAAQSICGKYNEKYAGTLTDIGIFSLNYHKHIHCGEGGIAVTNDPNLAKRMMLIRNHGENVVSEKVDDNISNLLGFNFRLTEISASIARQQLSKVENLVHNRINNCIYLNESLQKIPAIKPSKVRSNCQHAYYVHPFEFDETIAGVKRNVFIDAVKAELKPTELRENEGVKVVSGYVKPLYNLPLFQKRICFGNKGYPFNLNSKINYGSGLCPVAEAKYESELFFHELMHSFMTKEDLNDVISAFLKVWEHKSELRRNV